MPTATQYFDLDCSARKRGTFFSITAYNENSMIECIDFVSSVGFFINTKSDGNAKPLKM